MPTEVNPNRSDLDQTQIFQRAFNEDLDRIRVDAEISASIIAPPGLEVSISAVDDNIAIRNSNNSNELLINPDGSINIGSGPTGTSNINLLQVAGTSTAVNNGVANSGTQRVTIASDNTAFSVNAIQSGTWNIDNISGTISLPTGASTSTLQTTGNTSLSSIDSKLINLNTTAVKTVQLFTKSYDAITVTYPSGTQEVYISRTGGVAGTVQQTATVNYVDSTKANLLNVAVV